MRTSILSRSLVAVASVAVGSVALAAVPATAATPSGITREQILTAAAGVRSAPPGTAVGLFDGGSGFGPAANRAVRSMVNRVCVVDPDGSEVVYGSIAAATASGPGAEGLIVTAYLIDYEASTSTTVGRVCSFGALATVAGQSVLTGSATLTGAPVTPLAGDAFTTPAVNSPLAGSPSSATPTFTASGNAVQTVTTKIADTKSRKEKRAAKKAYAKRLTSAKKSYARALDRAGSSKRKKAAAKKAYRAKRSAAKATYRYAIAPFVIRTTKVATPFNVSAQPTFAP